MSVEVIRADAPEPPQPETGDVAASGPPDSPLAGLRRKIKDAREQTTMDRRVRGMEDVIVRFRPISSNELEDIDKRRGISRSGRVTMDKNLAASIDVIATAGVAIFIEVEGDLHNALGLDDPPTFGSPELAKDLEVTEQRASATVNAFYPFDGDIIGTANAILQFSGFTSAEVAERAQGNF